LKPAEVTRETSLNLIYLVAVLPHSLRIVNCHRKSLYPPLLPPAPVIVLDEIKITQSFIELLRTASLEDENLEPHILHQLRHPLEGVVELGDQDVVLSIENFITLTNASEDAYSGVCANIRCRYPDSQILSHHLVKQKIEELTGVVSLANDMCWKSCNGFTGALANLDNCPDCGESRWDPIRLAESGGETKIARRQFYTIPLGPQLQALWRSKEGATAMRYRTKKTQEILAELAANGGKLQHYNDLLSGTKFIPLSRICVLIFIQELTILKRSGAESSKRKTCYSSSPSMAHNSTQ
jgi:hypothetical protein